MHKQELSEQHSRSWPLAGYEQRALIITERARRAGGIDRLGREFAGKLQGCAGGKPAREPAAVTVHRDPASVHCTILVLLPIAPRTIMLDRAFFGHIFGNRIVWMNVIRTIWVDQTISVDLIILER